MVSNYWLIMIKCPGTEQAASLYNVLMVKRQCRLTISTIHDDVIPQFMMTSSNGDIFRVTGLLRGESTGHRWIPLTKVSDAELWCFLWSAPEQTVEQTIETPVIWDAHFDVTVMRVTNFVTEPADALPVSEHVKLSEWTGLNAKSDTSS